MPRKKKEEELTEESDRKIRTRAKTAQVSLRKLNPLESKLSTKEDHQTSKNAKKSQAKKIVKVAVRRLSIDNINMVQRPTRSIKPPKRYETDEKQKTTSISLTDNEENVIESKETIKPRKKVASVSVKRLSTDEINNITRYPKRYKADGRVTQTTAAKKITNQEQDIVEPKTTIKQNKIVSIKNISTDETTRMTRSNRKIQTPIRFKDRPRPVTDTAKPINIEKSLPIKKTNQKQNKIAKVTVKRLSADEINTNTKLVVGRSAREKNAVLLKKNTHQHIDNSLSSNKQISDSLNEIVKMVEPKTKKLIRKPLEVNSKIQTIIETDIFSELVNEDMDKAIPVQRSPIYKNKPISSSNLDPDLSVYDYFSNSQESQIEDDSMKKVIEKLRRENKITLMKKPMRKKVVQKMKDEKVLWGTGREKTIVKRGLQQIKKNLQNSYKNVVKTLVSPKAMVNRSNYVDISSDDEHNYEDHIENIVPLIADAPTNKTDLGNYTTINDLNESNEFSMIMQENNRPVLEKSKNTLPTKVNQMQKQSIIYKLSLNKPNYQSTPKRLPDLENLSEPQQKSMQLEGNASPWRVADEHIPRTFYFSTSRDHLPTYSSDVVHALPKSKLASCQSNNISSTVNSTSVNAVANKDQTGKQLEYSIDSTTANQEDSIHMTSSGISPGAPIILVDTLNLSNIENVEPENHIETQLKLKGKTTNIVLGERIAGARSPLKSLAIKNVHLSPINVDLTIKDLSSPIEMFHNIDSYRNHSVTQLGKNLVSTRYLLVKKF